MGRNDDERRHRDLFEPLVRGLGRSRSSAVGSQSSRIVSPAPSGAQTAKSISIIVSRSPPASAAS
jgi:hypothetical protein